MVEKQTGTITLQNQDTNNWQQNKKETQTNKEEFFKR